MLISNFLIDVAQAAKRFESWWTHCVESDSTMIQAWEKGTGPDLWKSSVAQKVGKTSLPPIGEWPSDLGK